MIVKRGITLPRLFGVMTGFYRFALLSSGAPFVDSSTSYIEEAGSTHGSYLTSTYGAYLVKSIHQNEQGSVIFFLGPIDLTNFKKLWFSWVGYKTCATCYLSCGLTLDKDCTGMTAGQKFKDFKVGSVELFNKNSNFNYEVKSVDITSYDNLYYIWFEVYGSDNTSSSKYTELDIYHVNIEA
jgi:hypothetical protein